MSLKNRVFTKTETKSIPKHLSQTLLHHCGGWSTYTWIFLKDKDRYVMFQNASARWYIGCFRLAFFYLISADAGREFVLWKYGMNVIRLKPYSSKEEHFTVVYESCTLSMFSQIHFGWMFSEPWAILVRSSM